MPVDYVRSLTAETRTRRSDRHLGLALAFIAGAAHAGAFLAVGICISNVTVLVCAIAELALPGRLAQAAAGALPSIIPVVDDILQPPSSRGGA